MLYFVAAIYGEHQRRARRQDPTDGLLCSGDAAFGGAAAGLLARVSAPEPIADVAAFERDVRDKIGPWNVERLCDPARENLYPYL